MNEENYKIFVKNVRIMFTVLKVQIGGNRGIHKAKYCTMQRISR